MIPNKAARLKLYARAWRKWGPDSQLDMVIEEAAELIQAVNKVKRYGYKAKNLDHLAEEVTDVAIMLEQTVEVLDLRTACRHHAKVKLARLAGRLKGLE